MQQEEIFAHANNYLSEPTSRMMSAARGIVPKVDNEVFAAGVAEGLNIALGIFAVVDGSPHAFHMAGGAVACALSVACNDLVWLQEE
jgi:hypothetical protein